MGRPFIFHHAQGDAGNLPPHTGPSQCHRTGVVLMFLEVGEDVDQQFRIGKNIACPRLKVNQNRVEPPLHQRVQKDGHIGHHRVLIGRAAVECRPSKVAELKVRRGTTQPKVNALYKDKGPAQFGTRIHQVDIGGARSQGCEGHVSKGQGRIGEPRRRNGCGCGAGLPK